MEEFFERNCIRGYHKVWEAAVREAVVCEREPESVSDQYAVAVRKKLFASKAVTGVFAAFATGRYTVTSVSVEHEHMRTIIRTIIHRRKKFAVANIS